MCQFFSPEVIVFNCVLRLKKELKHKIFLKCALNWLFKLDWNWKLINSQQLHMSVYFLSFYISPCKILISVISGLDLFIYLFLFEAFIFLLLYLVLKTDKELPLKSGIFRTDLIFLVIYVLLVFDSCMGLYIVIQICKPNICFSVIHQRVAMSLQHMVS